MGLLTTLNETYFFDHVFKGQSHTYDPDSYLFKDIHKLAEQKGIEIIYNRLGTEVYSKLGCFNFTVIKQILQPNNSTLKSKKLLFDPHNLVL
jgi:hypothetical protein